MSLSAGVSFYAALSLAPLLMLMLTVTSFLGPALQQNLIEELTRLLGTQVGESVRAVIGNADREKSSGVLSGIIGLVTLLVSSTGVFSELQGSMNKIFDVELKPHQGIRHVLRTRLLSLGLVISLGFLLLVSMFASAAMTTVVAHLGDGLPIGRAVDLGLSFVLFALMFGLMFKLLPDVRMEWSNVVGGGLITSGLFVIGKFLIGLYIGHSTTASSYGAAGSLIAMLVWVYYSAVIVFFGAEITDAWAERRGHAIEPSAQARWRCDADEPGRQGPDPEGPFGLHTRPAR